jgi:hypothetical protein
MDHWARIAPSEKEEYLFRDGFLRVDNTHLNNNDVEVHSTTDAGLKKLIDLLGLPPE